MNEELDKIERFKEYKERYRFWSDKQISQLSFQNNIFLTISLAMMGYFWKERSSVYTDLVIDLSLKIEWKIVLFLIGISILFFSVIAGLLLAISRLYDLRLTSNILLTRKRAISRNVSVKDEKYSNNSNYKICYSFWLLFTQYNEIKITSDDIRSDNTQLQSKFTKVRKLSMKMGVCTWTLMKIQTISLFISIFFLVAVMIIK